MELYALDNREYDYSALENEFRTEYDTILSIISRDAGIIDLGCGNGSLMKLLADKKNASVTGIEISQTGVDACIKKGLKAECGRIDVPLNFPDNAFDYAICNVTIQMVMFPEVLLSEMKRIARYQIISFPNFAYYKNRIDLLFNGRMPAFGLYDYKWYNTGHIHQLSIKDFYELIDVIGGLKIISHNYIKSGNPFKDILISKFPNMFDQLPIFLLEKQR